MKKKIEIKFNKTKELVKLIKDVYFLNEMGKKTVYINKSIKISKDNIYYTILSGLDYDIKLSNDIIDGYMIFSMEEKKGKYILLHPKSTYCVEENNKYIFY